MSTAAQDTGAPRAHCTVDTDGRTLFRVDLRSAGRPRLALVPRPKKNVPQQPTRLLDLEPHGDDGDLRAVLEPLPALAEGRWDAYLMREPDAVRERLRPGLRDLRALVDGNLREWPSPVAVRVPYATKDGFLADLAPRRDPALGRRRRLPPPRTTRKAGLPRMSIPFELPPENRDLSPHTGYTRAHWEAAADGLLTAAWRWSTPGHALLDLPGRPSRSGVRSDGLEGYARTFLAAAFRVAGADGDDPHDLLERYAGGLAAGTRTPGRDDTESWPLILDFMVQGQPMVESASIALGLRLTAPWLWKNLDPGVQDRAEEWLRARCVTPPRRTTGTSSRTPSPGSSSPSAGATARRPRPGSARWNISRTGTGRRLGTPTGRCRPSTTTTAGPCTSTRSSTPTSPGTPALRRPPAVGARRGPPRSPVDLRRPPACADPCAGGRHHRLGRRLGRPRPRSTGRDAGTTPGGHRRRADQPGAEQPDQAALPTGPVGRERRRRPAGTPTGSRGPLPPRSRSSWVRTPISPTSS
ncbi:hypothetical protein SHIRM173S_08477 [Streptomyces hirsutus]